MDFKEEEIRKAAGGGEQLLDFDKVKPAEIPLLALSGGVKLVGEASKIFREFIEALDLFVGRYLVLIAHDASVPVQMFFSRFIRWYSVLRGPG